MKHSLTYVYGPPFDPKKQELRTMYGAATEAEKRANNGNSSEDYCCIIQPSEPIVLYSETIHYFELVDALVCRSIHRS